LVPGLAVFTWGLQGGAAASPAQWTMDAAMLAMFVAIGWINRRTATGLQRQIDALDALNNAD
jgi:hypothetical protein